MAPTIKIIMLTLIFVFMKGQAFGQGFAWAKRAGGTGTDEGSNLYVDALGNSYVVGGFSAIASFESATLTTTPRVNINRSDDIFLAKYDTNGVLVWVKKMSTSNLDYGKDIAVDALGNIYVTGSFSGSATFGTTSLTSSGYMDAFIVKYDGNGDLLWARKAGGPFDDLGHSLGLDKFGNSYITGYFQGTASFGDYTLSSSGNTSFFLAKYDPDGKAVWAKSAGGSNSVIGFDMAVDLDGNSYVTGHVFGSAAFPPFQLPAGDRYQTFIAKYDADGNVSWVKKLTNAPWQIHPYDLLLDHAGNFYLTGIFTGDLDLDNFKLKSAGNYDAFIAKYDPEGKVIWAKNEGGADREDYLAIATNAQGDLFVAGNFQGTSTLGKSSFTSSGDSDIFIIKYDASGEAIYSIKAGGTEKDYIYHIALDTAGNAYITGYFSGTTFFGNTALASKGDTDMFIAKIGKVPVESLAIAIPPLDAFEYCAGSSVPVSFQVQGNFNEDNAFTAQLSDAAGSFASPTIIGTGKSSPLQVTIPLTTPAGSGYKIRVLASSPAVVSKEQNHKITIIPNRLAGGVSNIITPNGDGLNETFHIAEPCFPVNLMVYNRWGKMVYQQVNYQNSWGGEKLQEGIYYYKIISEAGQSWKGWVEIIR